MALFNGLELDLHKSETIVTVHCTSFTNFISNNNLVISTGLLGQSNPHTNMHLSVSFQ